MVKAWTVALVALIMSITTVPADAASDSGSWQLESSTAPVAPPVSSAQALAFLNEQRAANGIPGNLADNAELSQGCSEYTTSYVPAKGQYPHTELPSQPGYSAAGASAASQSDLAYRASKSNYEWWGPEANPWLGAPIHLGGLFNPAATTAWYGESSHAACMGVGVPPSVITPGLTAVAPTFYSLPGNGANNVAVSWNADEEPFTPGQAVGIPSSRKTGPYILLWPLGATTELASASLVGPNGESVSVKTVTPNTPAPPSPPNFPQVSTVGAYGSESFVIPISPLRHRVTTS